MGFAAGFNAGWSSVSQAMKEREARDQREELAAIAKANPEESQGFMQQDATKLGQAAANAENVFYDEGTQSYTVVPKMADGQMGPAAPQNFAAQGVTDFLGKRTAGTMSPEQTDRARMTAMTGVISKTDPVRALAMRQQMSQEDRQNEVFSQQKKQWGREDAEYKKNQDWETGRQQLLEQSPIAQSAKQFEAEMAKHQEDMKLWQEAGQLGPAGPAPAAPQRKMPTPAEQLSAWVPLMQHDYKYGKLSTEGALNFQQQIKKLDDENYTKAIMAAQNGADAQTVTKLFNQAGTKIPEGSLVINTVKDQAGMPVKIMEYTDPQTGQKMTINTGAEAAMLGKLRELHQDFFAGKVDQRGDAGLVLNQNADKRAQNAATQGAADRKRDLEKEKERVAAAVGIFTEQNPGATPAQIEAVRRGVIPAVPKEQSYKLEYGEVAQAFGTPALDSQGKPIIDILTGKPTINRNLEEETKFLQWMKKNNIKDSNKGLLEYKGAATGAKNTLQNVTDADIKATAKKYNITEDEVRKRLNLK
jgi:hypothetical protein